MGLVTRAVRNISRRKIRALLVIIALGFSLSIMIALPTGIAANQQATQRMTGNLSNTITETEASINQTLTEIDCSLTPSAPSGFSFTPGGGSTYGFGGNNGYFNSGGSGSYGNGSVMRYGGGPFGSGASTPMNETYYSDIGSVSGVAAVEPVLRVTEGHNQTVTPRFVTRNGASPPTGFESQGFNITVPDYIITGVPLDASLINNYPILPTNITAGRNLQADETGSVVLSENSSAYFGKGVGGTVTILGKDFQVVGIYGPTGVSDTQLVYMNLADAHAITGNTDEVTEFRVFANSSDDVSSVATGIQALYPELQVTTGQERLAELQQMQSTYDQQLQNAQNTMTQTNTLATEETVIAVSATSVIVLFVMLYTVRERTKEIGTLKAIGFSNGNVMSQFMLEGIFLSLLAGVVGIVISLFAAPTLASLLLPLQATTFVVRNGAATVDPTTVGFALTPELVAIALGAAVLLGALGSVYPAWRASRTRPAEAMKYE
jgi:putative ABC transport system permease protein